MDQDANAPEPAETSHHLMLALKDEQVVESVDGPITLRHHAAGNLIVTSGGIVACDPILIEDEPQPFVTRIEPGHYPVILSIASFPNSDERVAYATLQVRKQDPVRWEAAQRSGDETDDDDTAWYPVDSGKGCFMDADALRALLDRLEREETDDSVYEEINIGPGPLELVSEAVNASRTPTWGWANVGLEPDTAANVVGFSSGWGDGGYATYLGYDASEDLVCFTTDFALFGDQSEP